MKKTQVGIRDSGAREGQADSGLRALKSRGGWRPVALGRLGFGARRGSPPLALRVLRHKSPAAFLCLGFCCRRGCMAPRRLEIWSGGGPARTGADKSPVELRAARPPFAPQPDQRLDSPESLSANSPRASKRPGTLSGASDGGAARALLAAATHARANPAVVQDDGEPGHDDKCDEDDPLHDGSSRLLEPSSQPGRREAIEPPYNHLSLS